MGVVTPMNSLNSQLRSALCAPLDVVAVPIGYAVSTGFVLPDGDTLSFYLVADDERHSHFEDDGTTLPDAVARGFDMRSPQREALLRSMLDHEGARYAEDLVIRSQSVDNADLGRSSLRFIAALIRTRDLFLVNRENVAASFADDVRRALAPKLPLNLTVEEGAANEPGSPDIVLRTPSDGLKAARIYAAGGDLRLMDALSEHQASGPGDSPVIAVVDRRKSRVSDKRFNRATNKGLRMAVVDDGSTEWVPRVLRLVADRDGAAVSN